MANKNKQQNEDPFKDLVDLNDLAGRLRQQDKKCQLIFAHNGTGKTRLSMAFKDLGKQDNSRDTLYFNAFTEDLFFWDNDLDNDTDRVLVLNDSSKFFAGIWALELDNRIRPLLQKYVDFDFRITKEKHKKEADKEEIERWEVSFFLPENPDENIKVSRGEEHIFIWCFFLAILQLSLDKEDGSPYEWVKYVYIDDPISSLDDNYAVSVAHNLATMLKDYKKINYDPKKDIKFIISTHHGLFFNVLCNELNKVPRYLLSKNTFDKYYFIKLEGDTASLYHVAMLKVLKDTLDNNEPLYPYHFNILRNIMEKTANFHGLAGFKKCIELEDAEFYERLIPVLNHGGYSVFEPKEMLPENKENFVMVLRKLLDTYPFHQDLSPNLFKESQL
ncbi:AAA family ATPase [Neisseria subflava]|jgi:glutamate synthase|uniref:Anticodon nuclease n=2 Tax=Pseudomonadota TaxID=1224 RepID=A0A369Z904_HAEPA|nr:AAA family ATPase [Haemophilus parainfluenzae]RDE95122.1 anticodon nuclease [Haemophilus parainfluenzae]UTG75296.1 AAA family ATPase [Neisseria subflava]